MFSGSIQGIVANGSQKNGYKPSVCHTAERGKSGFHRPQTGKPGDVPWLNSKITLYFVFV